MPAKLNFSFSKMGMYRECPLKYKFRYVLRIPELPKPYFAFGSALHRVMEFIYASRTDGKLPPLETILQFYKTDWEKTSYEQKAYVSKEKEDEAFAEGLRIIKAYYDKHAGDVLFPLSTEMRTTVEIDGLAVTSVLDRVDYLGGGKIAIVDYKTGKSAPKEPDQLLMYQKLMKDNETLKNLVLQRDPAVKKIEIGKMYFYFLPTLKEEAYEPADKKQIDGFWKGVLATAEDILAGKFGADPSEGKCRWCDYKDRCPVWTTTETLQSAARQAPEEEKLPLNSGEEQSDEEALSQKIDEYGLLKEKLDVLEKEIKQDLQKNNFLRHFGKNYQAELQTVESASFDDHKAVMAQLDKFNLTGKVLVPTLDSILKLLNSPDILPAQKKALEAHKETKKEIKLKITKTRE